MNEDLAPVSNLLMEIRHLRSQIALRKRIESNDEPFFVTKSVADYQDGYFTEMKGIHIDWVKRDTQHMEECLKKLEEKLVKMKELL